MTRKTKTAKPQNVAPSMKAAAAMWGISYQILKAAKAGGSRAFRSGRVNQRELLAWVRSNPRAVAEAEQAARQRAALDELKRQKLALEVSILGGRLDRDKAAHVLREVACEVWAECWEICQQSAEGLLDPDFLRVWKERCQSRLQAPLARLQRPAESV